MSNVQSLQDRYAPGNACFGCGPANERGLRIKSFPEGDEVVAEFRPEKHHEAFEGMLCGGIAGTLLDCHLNWTAAHHLLVRDGLDHPPCTVTASYRVDLRRPTPTDGTLTIRARVRRSEGSRVDVEGEILSGDVVTVRGEGTFVAVREGHPAYHRW